MKKLSTYFNKIHQKYQKYLPSKGFTLVIGIIIVILILVFSVSFIFESLSSKTFMNKDGKAQIKAEDQTVIALLQTDTDSDGVFDWEETLWGTNKYKTQTFDQTPDLTYIENKKKELNIEDEAEDKALTETDKFAREFFSAYTAMQGTDKINNKVMENFATSLGQNIVHPNLVDKYAQADIKLTKQDNADQQEAYYTSVADLFAKYEAKGIGEELAIISKGLEAYQIKQSPNSFKEITRISDAYKNFAMSVVSIPVPESLAKYHLRIVNGAYNTGISVANMAKVINDPLVGVSGVSEYEKYSGEFSDAVADLEASFE